MATRASMLRHRIKSRLGLAAEQPPEPPRRHLSMPTNERAAARTVNVWLIELASEPTETLWLHWLDQGLGQRHGISWVKNPWCATWFTTGAEADAALVEMASASRACVATMHSFDLGTPSALYAMTGGGEPFIRAMRLAGHIVDLPDAIASEEARRNG